MRLDFPGSISLLREDISDSVHRRKWSENTWSRSRKKDARCLTFLPPAQSGDNQDTRTLVWNYCSSAMEIDSAPIPWNTSMTINHSALEYSSGTSGRHHSVNLLYFGGDEWPLLPDTNWCPLPRIQFGKLWADIVGDALYFQGRTSRSLGLLGQAWARLGGRISHHHHWLYRQCATNLWGQQRLFWEAEGPQVNRITFMYLGHMCCEMIN